MPITLGEVENAFASQVKAVEQLLEFDRFIFEHVVGGLSKVGDELAEVGQNNAARIVTNRVAALQTSRMGDALRPHYETMFNQCVVLLVSYFGSTAGDLFRAGVATAFAKEIEVPAVRQTVELTWQDVWKPDAPLDITIADFVFAQHGGSFQDMQSITRAFKESLGVTLAKNERTNDIILGQAARHIIVHTGGIVDSRMLKQLAGASERRLKPVLAAGVRIQFSREEVHQLAATMQQYITAAVTDVRRALGESSSST